MKSIFWHGRNNALCHIQLENKYILYLQPLYKLVYYLINALV